jgi:hypothetical protein
MRLGLLATAASLAFISAGVLAQAQDTKGHEERPAAARSEGVAAQPGKASAQSDERMKGDAGEPGKRAAQSEERPKEDAGQPAKRAAQSEERSKEDAGQPGKRAAQSEPRENGAKPSEPMKKNAERNSEARKDAQNPAERSDQRSAERPKERSDARVGSKDERGEHGQPHVVGNVRTSNEHASRATDILMRSGRHENVNIDVRVGTRIPESVTIYPVPAEVLAFAPEYREYNYFVENDEIVFVAPESHEIVGMIQYEGRAASTDETRVAGARPCPIEN